MKGDGTSVNADGTGEWLELRFGNERINASTPGYAFADQADVLINTKAAARELGPDNIRVNALCPSFIDTDITAGLLTPERLDAILQSVPMGRPGHAHEVAGCVVFLASELSSYVTGSEIDINGGSHIH